MDIDDYYAADASEERTAPARLIIHERNRTQILMHRDLILSLLKRGHTLKAIYFFLKDTKKLSMSYPSFTAVVKRRITKQNIRQFVLDEEISAVKQSASAANSNGQSAPAPVKTSAPVTPVAGTVGGNGTKTVIPAMNRFPSLKEREEMRRQAEQAAAAQNGQKPKQEKELKLPSFDNWDGDSRKYIKELVGE